MAYTQPARKRTNTTNILRISSNEEKLGRLCYASMAISCMPTIFNPIVTTRSPHMAQKNAPSRRCHVNTQSRFNHSCAFLILESVAYGNQWEGVFQIDPLHTHTVYVHTLLSLRTKCSARLYIKFACTRAEYTSNKIEHIWHHQVGH